jgi:predicted Fe-Mo cluster-binding NifX family protein
VQADPEQKKILNTRAVTPPEHVPGLFPRWVREQGAGVVIVGGIGQRAIALFTQQGITVRAGEPGATVESVVTAYLNGQLTATPEGCEHHGHHHDHEHHHDGHGHHHEHGDASENAH